MNHHLEDCEYPVPCPNVYVLEREEGTKQVKWRDVPFHLTDECPLQKVQCTYWDHGSRVEIQIFMKENLCTFTSFPEIAQLRIVWYKCQLPGNTYCTVRLNILAPIRISILLNYNLCLSVCSLSTKGFCLLF
ncbi:hypothetical protein LOD99_5182 [Oopsacas minuta]|uniref:TRAF-type domain-containing protein n=1 Tax=Oopsacas minuta TaxID=111878 RepID=A0AAV7JSR5_9METZ|nr:hypothetical protein LOD99_5182 [Oopsacas minuta]